MKSTPGWQQQQQYKAGSIYKKIKLNLNHLFLFRLLFPLFSTANTGLYAHYVFNTLDKDHTGTLSFEVS